MVRISFFRTFGDKADVSTRDLPCLVGRSAECAFQPSSESVSRQHAEFRFDGSNLVLADLNSRNGTFVNGTRVCGVTSVPSGAKVRFADCEYEVIVVGR